jgi:probable F420-dependent oxidoreductase
VRIGVVFPQTEIEGDVGAIRAYATRVEELGYTHVLAYDHVLGADPSVHAPWHGPYDVHTTFHEPFVLFGFLAGITSLELVTGIVILPQRQTALAAKQAAEVDLLSGGRFRFGVGLGWNPIEYEALGKDFSNRGRRMEEQIDLMRRLWTEPSLTFEGSSNA